MDQNHAHSNLFDEKRYPMTLPSVSLCFPAYNEELTVAGVILEADQLMSASGYDYEIIVCDDGSQDRTGEIIDRLATELSRIRVIRHKKNTGIQSTFEELYGESSKDFVFLNSTDGQWDTRIVLEMLPMTDRWDIIVASRKRKPYTKVRLFISWVYNTMPLILFGVKTYDAGAVKLVRKEIINKIRLISKSPFGEAERMIRAARAGYRVTEYPVEVRARKTGHSHGVRWGLLVQSIVDIFRVWWSIIKDRNEINHVH